jgi:hypothetical protein
VIAEERSGLWNFSSLFGSCLLVEDWTNLRGILIKAVMVTIWQSSHGSQIANSELHLKDWISLKKRRRFTYRLVDDPTSFALSGLPFAQTG